MSPQNEGLVTTGWSLAVLALFLLAWQFLPGLVGVPEFVLPPPTRVGAEAMRIWQTERLLWHAGITALEVVIGFVLGALLGAIIGYALCSARRDLLHSAVLMAVPHPQIVAQHLLVPKHVQRSFHWWFFQQAELPEQALMANDMAFIDYLWHDWSVPDFQDKEHIAQAKTWLSQPGVMTTALAYYRAMFDMTKADPALTALRENMNRKIALPTLALCGAQDMRAELMREQAPCFAGHYEYQEVANAGHFLQREQSQAVNEHLLRWLARTP